jgi:hypothetical protein
MLIVLYKTFQTRGDVPPTRGSVPPTRGSVPPTRGSVPPTRGSVPPTRGDVPPTRGSVPPTRGSVPPTWGDVPPTRGSLPPTRGDVPRVKYNDITLSGLYNHAVSGVGYARFTDTLAGYIIPKLYFGVARNAQNYPARSINAKVSEERLKNEEACTNEE